MKSVFLFIYCSIHLIIFCTEVASASSENQSGIISGKVLDADNLAPLVGVNVIVQNSNLGAVTDTAGIFIIYNVAVGNYTLEFSYIGYETYYKPDVIIRARRFTNLEIKLKSSPLETAQTMVYGGYFLENNDQPVSLINFSAEEIRRAPGSAGDVSRILMSLPSVAKINDQSNSLIVRGGSPIENAFYVDQIEIPNINHFPTQGASGGPIGLLQVDFINDVNFYSGGFSAGYGDKLSSIMEISFREGNRHEFDGQLDLNFAGFGGMGEGPLFDKKGSWLLAFRRSYLDFLLHIIDMGTTASPSYGDIQGKLVFDLNPHHRLSVLLIAGDDHNNPSAEQAVENDMLYYGNQNIYESTSGLTWRALWSQKGYSNTSLAYTSTRFKEDFFETSSNARLLKNRSVEQVYKFSNLNHFYLDHDDKLEFGTEAKYLVSTYHNYYAAYTDAVGQPTPALAVDQIFNAIKCGGYINLMLQPFAKTSIIFGSRLDYFSYNRYLHFSPRLMLTYQIHQQISVQASTGIYYQTLPTLLLAQNPNTRYLADPRAVHYIAGINYMVTENTKVSLEIYQKDYCDFIMDPTTPALFLIDELFYRYGFFFNHDRLNDQGKARSRGLEIILQKKLAQKLYGLASLSYFRTSYQGLDGHWRNRIFDNRLLLSVEGGYKPNSRWEFSLRWIYAGGSPYTPLNIAASQQINRAVLDVRHINANRYPAYHSLNVRFDRRCSYLNSNLVFYLSLWNAYNRKNIATYFWNEQKKQVGAIYQWSLLPIFGLEYEF